MEAPRSNKNSITTSTVQQDGGESNETRMTQPPPHMSNEDAVTEESISPIPPSAPTKPQLRRRLFDKLRTKRRQMIVQHHNQYNNSDIGSGGGGGDDATSGDVTIENDGSTGPIGTTTGSTKIKTKKPSLVTHYYRVDTVPRKALQLPPRHKNSQNIGTTASFLSDDTTRNTTTNTTTTTTATAAVGSNLMDTTRTSTSTSTAGLTHHHSPPSVMNGKKRRNQNQDRVVNVILPGVPSYEEDWARDTHDYFNLIILVPVTVLNIMNWNWDILLSIGNNHNSNHRQNSRHQNSNDLGYMEYYEQMFDTVQYAWTGDWFDIFFYCTAAYFIIDLLWIIILPICVKSPSTIIQHHIAVLLYIMIPYVHPNFRFCMGACMTVEINTWFLIARRVFNKQGFPPWTLIELNSWLSIRVKVISIFFYLTWISIRCILYPGLLIPFFKLWRTHTQQTGTVLHLISAACLLHVAFCLLNLKWSYELLMSKIRYFRRQYILRKQQLRHDRNHPHSNNRYHYQPDPSISEGL